MKCPACGKTLSALEAGEISVDACTDGCGGVWLDQHELLKFDEPHEFETHKLLELAKQKQGVHIDHKKQKHCPKCPNEPLVRQFLDEKNEVEMDQCWTCAGVWLDLGEINTIRGQYKSMSDRSKAVNTYVDSMLLDVKKDLQSKTKRDVEIYNSTVSSRARGALYALKKLLGLDDPYDGL